MNKDKSQFARLSDEDRRYILDLCAKQSYDSAVDLLKKPRSLGGLGIHTSRSALCRFYTTAQLEAAPELLAQRAAVTQVRYEQRSNAFLTAIRAEIEERVLQNLYNGKALADLENDLRLLKHAQSLYLADAQWRARHPKEARAAYQAHVDRCARASGEDFVPVEEAPDASDLFAEPSSFEEDVEKARTQETDFDAQHREILATLFGDGYDHSAEPAEYPNSSSETQKAP